MAKIYARVLTTMIFIHIGKVEVMSIEVSSRKQMNGRNRARTLAIGIHSSWIGGTSAGGMWKSMSVQEALDLIDSMELDEVRKDFIEMCKQRGWSDELPSQEKGQLELC